MNSSDAEKRNVGEEIDGTAAEFDETAPKTPRATSRLRKWGFRLAAMTAIPAAFFGLLELGLWTFGYGEQTAYFVRVPNSGDRTSNPAFAWRFFPQAGSRAPVAMRFPAEKPPGTVRVFVFGGSAAMGSPEAAFSFARVLEAMLHARWPERRFEVINTAMEGMSSHVARVIADEAADLQPDLFVIYLGNNEVTGPYGLSDAFTTFTPSLSVIRASIWARTTRTGQLLRNVLRSFGGRDEVWKGMETFRVRSVPADDLRLGRTYAHLRENLRAILAAGRRGGAATVLCTVATNLRDCAPFLSVHRAGLGAKDKTRWAQHYEAGVQQAAGGDHEAALASYGLAAEIDDRFAELHYRIGLSALATDRGELALKHLVLARELDGLRVRSDENINRVVRGLAGEADALVDAEKAFAAHEKTSHGLPGNDLFLDHVHMNFEGNYVLAVAVFRKVAELIAPRPGGGRSEAPPPADRVRCRKWLALTGWDRYRIAQAMVRVTALPPFTNQCDHAQRHAEVQARAERLRPFAEPGVRDATLELYRTALRDRPDDPLLRESYAVCLLGFGENAAALEQLKQLRDRLPGRAEVDRQIGETLVAMGRFDAAARQFRKVLAAVPMDLHARSNLGAALLWQGQAKEAVTCFRRVLEVDPDHEGARTNLAIAQARAKQNAAARENFERVLRRNPGHINALRNYARLLVNEGKAEEAVQQWKKALATREEHVIHLELGGILAELGRADEAMPHYRRAVEIAPHAAEAHLALGQALLKRKDYKAAAASLAKALTHNDQLPEAHRDLGIACQRLGRLGEATARYAKAIALRPGDWPTRERLAYVLLLRRKWAECIQQYEQVLALEPNRAEAHNNVAVALTKLDRTREAILHFAAAVKLEPNALRHYNLATQLVRHGQDREAVVHYQRARALRPAWPEVLGELAWVLATADDPKIRNGAEAVRLARQACQFTHNRRADMVDALAAALAEVGQFEAAAAAAEQARTLALAAGQRQMADRIAKRITLYQSNQPCRRGAREIK